MEGLALIAAILGPPLAVGILGLRLGSDTGLRGRLRGLGLALILLGFGEIVVMYLSVTACSPFDDPTCGESWTDYFAAYAGWVACVTVLTGAVAIGIARLVTKR
jgi:hypothetical protein